MVTCLSLGGVLSFFCDMVRVWPHSSGPVTDSICLWANHDEDHHH